MRAKYVVFKTFEGVKIVKDLEKDWLRRRRQAVFAWADVINSSEEYKSYKKCMVSLTFATPEQFSIKHLSDYLRNLTRRKSVKVYAYVWTMELQERGVPHYHCVVLYTGHFPTPDTSGMWKHGTSNVRYRIRTVYYLCSYVSKKYQLDFQNMPRGAHGVGLYIRDKKLRADVQYLRMNERDKTLFKIGGIKEVRENKKRPDMFKSEYIGSTVTRGLADMYADKLPLDNSGE